MSIQTIPQTTVHATVVAALLNATKDGASRIRHWMSAASKQRKMYQMRAVLSALDNRTLADIGIHRSDIPRVVAGFSPRELGMEPIAKTARTKGYPKDACLGAV